MSWCSPFDEPATAVGAQPPAARSWLLASMAPPAGGEAGTAHAAAARQGLRMLSGESIPYPNPPKPRPAVAAPVGHGFPYSGPGAGFPTLFGLSLGAA